MKPAEYVGHARHDADGVLRIGEGPDPVEIQLTHRGVPGWWEDGTVDVYVRRMSDTGEIVEIVMARHDGLADEDD
jgi:hypothetical protein